MAAASAAYCAGSLLADVSVLAAALLTAARDDSAQLLLGAVASPGPGGGTPFGPATGPVPEGLNLLQGVNFGPGGVAPMGGAGMGIAFGQVTADGGMAMGAPMQMGPGAPFGTVMWTPPAPAPPGQVLTRLFMHPCLRRACASSAWQWAVHCGWCRRIEE